MPRPPARPRRADDQDSAASLDRAGFEVARAIEERVARVVAHARAALRAFVEGTGHDQVNPPPAKIGATELERLVAEWRPLVPSEPARRAAVGRHLAARHRLNVTATPEAVAALGLDEIGLDPPETGLDQPVAPVDDPTEALVRRLERDAEWVRLARGGLLCRQGDPADAMYVVVSGRLRVFVAGDGGAERFVGEMGRGDAIGEMGLISGEQRTATLYASRDTELVRLPKAAFDRLVEENPRFLLSITRQIVDRLRMAGTRRRTRSTLSTIAVMPAGRGAPPIERVAARLGDSLRPFGRVALVGRANLDGALGEGTADALERDPTDQRAMAWIAGQEADHRFVVYRADPTPSAWTLRCAQQADHLLFVADADGSAEPSDVERILPPRDPRSSPVRSLLLLHPDREARPRGTSRWLDGRDLDAHDHAQPDTPTDFDRVARRITGRAIGLVFGGGGARGLSHIGAIEALAAHGIPIDVIGGTSMGAIIGALLALDWSPDEMRRRIGEQQESARIDLTLPIVSLLSGHTATRQLEEFCGDAQIEDLWTPFFCVSSNLTRGEVMVHQRGSLRKYVRASISVGGIIPPVTDDGDLLVDGGVLNNLPADVMRRFCPDGSVIAVNVNPRTGLRSAIDYGEALSLRDIVRDQFQRRSRRLRVPNVFDILERITMLGSIRQSSELARTTIDLYLHPETDDIPFAGFKGAANTIPARAREYALPLVETWKAAHTDAAAWRVRRPPTSYPGSGADRAGSRAT